MRRALSVSCARTNSLVSSIFHSSVSSFSSSSCRFSSTHQTSRRSFSSDKKALLVELVPKYKLIVSRSTNKSTAKVKAVAWAALTIKFNSTRGFYKRDEAQLKKCWDNLKTKWKKEKAVENQNRAALRPNELTFQNNNKATIQAS